MNARQFIDALRAVEEHGDVEPMAKLYAHEARLWNPQLHEPMRGPDGAREFWREYRKTFASISSEFQSVVEGDGIAALEWNSTGHLRQDNEPFQYRGVSMVEWKEGGITRFAAYFDPNRLSAHAHTAAMRARASREDATGERHAAPEERVSPRMEAPARPAGQADQASQAGSDATGTAGAQGGETAEAVQARSSDKERDHDPFAGGATYSRPLP